MMKKLFALLLIALLGLIPAAQASVTLELAGPEQYYGENPLFCYVGMPEKQGTGHDEVHILDVSANIAIWSEDTHGNAMFITNFIYLYDPVGDEHFELGLWHWGGVNASSDIWLYFETSTGPEQYTKTFIGPAESNHSYNCRLILGDDSTHLHAFIDGVFVAEWDFAHVNNRIWKMVMESSWLYNVAGSCADALIMRFQFWQDGWKMGMTNWRYFSWLSRHDYPYSMTLYLIDLTYTFLEGVVFHGGFDYNDRGGSSASVCHHM